MVVYSKRDFLKRMPDVLKYNDNITALNEQWENLELLCEINCPVHSKSILPAMGEIQRGFYDLQQKLVDTLISETMNKLEQKTVSKAQVAIDILIRNLYERTADVGFLATDDDIRRFTEAGSTDKVERAKIVERLREYVAKYSVYKEIVILDKTGLVLANLDERNPIVGQVLNGPIFEQTMQSAAGFTESFRHSVLQPVERYSHVFSRKIYAENSTEAVGIICLCFRFRNEMKQIFKNLCTDYDGSVITIIDNEQRVIASSDETHVMPGAKVEPYEGDTYGIIYYRGQEYIARTVTTQGYQDYFGLGWRGHIMIPLKLAFKEKAAITGIDPKTRDALMLRADSFSQALNDIINQTQTINRSLKWIVYNGQIISRDTGASDESTRLKPILDRIGQMGARTGKLFQKSVQNLFATLVSTGLIDVSFLASLCVDIMDRNLYERANDCRWWALNPTFREALAAPELSAFDQDRLTQILVYINSLYTVYSNLFLFNASGVIVAVSNPSYSGFIGRKLAGEYVYNILGNSRAESYYVSPFEPTDLYGGKHTYIYGASITDIANPSRTVGGVGIVFDSEYQFNAMLEESIKMKKQCYAVFTDRKGSIIASTNAAFKVGERLTVPQALLRQANGQASHDIIVQDGSYYAIGCACSSNYREYKSVDGYKNDVLAFVLEKIADNEDAAHVGESGVTIEQSAITLSATEPHIKLVTFSVNGQLFGVPHSAVLEAIGADNSISIPGASGQMRMATMYAGQYVAVVGLRQIFYSDAQPCDNPYLLLIKNRENDRVALEVDDLNSVLEVNSKDVKPVPRISDNCPFITSLVCFDQLPGNRYLLVLDHNVLFTKREIGELVCDLSGIREAIAATE